MLFCPSGAIGFLYCFLFLFGPSGTGLQSKIKNYLIKNPFVKHNWGDFFAFVLDLSKFEELFY